MGEDLPQSCPASSMGEDRPLPSGDADRAAGDALRLRWASGDPLCRGEPRGESRGDLLGLRLPLLRGDALRLRLLRGDALRLRLRLWGVYAHVHACTQQQQCVPHMHSSCKYLGLRRSRESLRSLRRSLERERERE